MTWLLDIFEIAHQTVPGVLSPGYPNMALTAFVVLVFSSAFGAGLGLVASALIRNEDVRQAGAATAVDPSDGGKLAEDQAICPNDLRFGSRELTAIVRVEGAGHTRARDATAQRGPSRHSRTTHLS